MIEGTKEIKVLDVTGDCRIPLDLEKCSREEPSDFLSGLRLKHEPRYVRLVACMVRKELLFLGRAELAESVKLLGVPR
ncbi:MAG: hypothetical protein QXQ11_08520 [Candidatus Bathyarchaeia archaeon]